MKISINVRNYPNKPYWIQPFLKPYGKAPEQVPQHSHGGEYEWFFCRSGGGIQLVEDWQCTVEPGQLLLIPPGLAHVFCSWPEGCQCDVVMLPSQYLQHEGDEAALEAQALLNYWKQYVTEHGYLIDLDEDAAAKCRKLFARIRRTFGEYGFGRMVKTHALTYELLALAFAFKHPPPKTLSVTESCDEQIQNILFYLDNHFYDRLAVEDVIRIGGMSRSSFHQRFQKATGMTFCRYLNRLRLDAVEKLHHMGMNLEEAALQCGFGSRSNYYQQRRNDEMTD